MMAQKESKIDSWRIFREFWLSLTPQKKQKWLNNQTEEDIASLNWWLIHWAREKQLPPSGGWYVWLVMAGRGYGKTRIGSEWVVHRVKQGYKRIALVGQTKADVRDTMIELSQGSCLTHVCRNHNIKIDYQPSKRRVIFPEYGATATVFSGDAPDQLRGPQHDSAWIDELFKFKYPENTWNNLEMGLRIGGNPRAVVTSTPRPMKLLDRLRKDKQTIVTTGHMLENKDNLNDRFVNRMLRKYGGTRLGRQELAGEVLDDNPNALWEREWIENNRIYDIDTNELETIAVAVDPAGSQGNDDCGIIVMGRKKIGGVYHGYILDDMTTDGRSKIWSKTVVTAYKKWNADYVVGESNFGGDMVETVIHGALDDNDKPIGRNIPVRLIHASRGKRVRAEPISQKSEQGLLHHVGSFSDLENELCQWVPGDPSPNRLDALVWAGTELLLDDGFLFL